MKQIRSLIVLLVVMLMPLAANASHQKEGQIDIPEMGLEHLSAYNRTQFGYRRLDAVYCGESAHQLLL